MDRKEEKIKRFDPNGIGHINGRLFGLPFNLKESDVIIIPVPWEVTASGGAGTANGPASILSVSNQIDLFIEDFPDFWKRGAAMCSISPKIIKENRKLRGLAETCISHQEKGGSTLDGMTTRSLKLVNQGCELLNSWVRAKALTYLKTGKLVGVLGGDHSICLGLVQALSKRYASFGFLHIDAHLDLRLAYEGFDYSHASVMRNAFGIKEISRFVHVGVRDICQDEYYFSKEENGKSAVFSYDKISEWLFRGGSWEDLCGCIVECLPDLVYISFDIDGLNPSLCPNTGTPVPGGLDFYQAVYLIRKIVESRRKIVGFDLCEVAPASPNPDTWPDDWNAIVGMRVLYWLCCLALKSWK